MYAYYDVLWQQLFMMCVWLQLFTGGSYRRQPNYYYDDGVVSYGAAGRSMHPVSVDILSSKHILPFLAVFLHAMQKKSSILRLMCYILVLLFVAGCCTTCTYGQHEMRGEG